MKKISWMFMAVLVAGCCLLPVAQAQETATAVAPAAPAPVAKPAKTGNSFFGSSRAASTNGGGMVITSERMELDYKETNAMVIAFDENVRVTDPQYTMTADRMLVFLEGTNQIRRIIAVGHVDVAQPDKHATCEKAVYEHATGEIVLTGNPVLNRGADRVVGARIIVYQNDQRVVVEGGGRVNLSPETLKNREVKP